MNSERAAERTRAKTDVRDEEHFLAVLFSKQVQAALTAQGLTRTETWPMGRLHNGGMKVFKDSWTIPLPAQGIEGVNVHFESRRPGEIQIDVEVFPYEGSLEQHPECLSERQRHLDLKARLIEAIRAEMTEDARCIREFGLSTKGLRAPAVPSTLCAVIRAKADQCPMSRMSRGVTSPRFGARLLSTSMLEGNWIDNIRKSFQKKKPADGWPK